jgi:hypothetical protein
VVRNLLFKLLLTRNAETNLGITQEFIFREFFNESSEFKFNDELQYQSGIIGSTKICLELGFIETDSGHIYVPNQIDREFMGGNLLDELRSFQRYKRTDRL